MSFFCNLEIPLKKRSLRAYFELTIANENYCRRIFDLFRIETNGLRFSVSRSCNDQVCLGVRLLKFQRAWSIRREAY